MKQTLRIFVCVFLCAVFSLSAKAAGLVLNGKSNDLKLVPGNFDPSRLEIGFATTGNNIISSNFTSGEIAGLLDARTQLTDPLRSQLARARVAWAADRAAGFPGVELPVKRNPNFPSYGNRKFPTWFTLRPLPCGRDRPSTSL